MEKKPLFPPIRYFGGKTLIAPFLREYIPALTDHYQIYVEPFFGTGGLFFNLLQAPKSAIINDKDDLIYNFWWIFRNHLEAFEKELDLVWCGKAWYDEYSQRTDPVGKAIYLYLLNKNNHSGGANTERWDKRFLINPFYKTFDTIKEYLNSILYLTIWNDDFRDVLQKIQGSGFSTERENRFYIYEDPPYYTEGHRYRIPFIEQDHLDLFTLNSNLQTESNKTIFLSYDDCAWVRQHYTTEAGWYLIEISLDTIRKGYHELFISNKPFQKNVQQKFKQKQLMFK